jgi:hypothetical protein
MGLRLTWAKKNGNQLGCLMRKSSCVLDMINQSELKVEDMLQP